MKLASYKLKLNLSFALMLGAVIAILTPSALAISKRAQQLIEERLRPPSVICLEGEPCAAGTIAKGGPARSGRTIYDTSCFSCHASGVGDAPLLGDRRAWSSRRAKGVDTLYQSVLDGFNAMPAMGACVDCSEEEIQAAVDYMLDQI